MDNDASQTVALTALAWLAGDPELCEVFLSSTGSDVEQMRESAADPVYLAAVLDFILMDDAWVERLCRATGLAAEQPMQARQLLPGGFSPTWT